MKKIIRIEIIVAASYPDGEHPSFDNLDVRAQVAGTKIDPDAMPEPIRSAIFNAVFNEVFMFGAAEEKSKSDACSECGGTDDCEPWCGMDPAGGHGPKSHE